MPEGVRVLDAAARRFGIALALDHFDWSCDNYDKHGWWMPPDWRERDRRPRLHLTSAPPAGPPGARSRLAVGFADEVAQGLRSVREPAPGAADARHRAARWPNRKVGDIDYYVVRENTEGEYSAVGGRLFEGTEREMAMQQSTFTRKGVDRIMKYAFELAMTAPAQASHLRDQVERHLHHHAVLGRALRGDGRALSRR